MIAHVRVKAAAKWFRLVCNVLVYRDAVVLPLAVVNDLIIFPWALTESRNKDTHNHAHHLVC